ncbi:MAG TPA: alpha/beta hydrolase [Verrucomicrobiales bacterium]|nr:alpha/beta hydrolase [Verrucomicrobiales bacterium]HRJ07861.1 alpha/beta hydrolase [Prosthecobacter sp.]HRK15404.1 alpha/beta hydrolase [Prosthecobacter sp.]
MKSLLFLSAVSLAAFSHAQEVKRDVPYVTGGHARQVLDIHAPAKAEKLPVVFWIHGGGWQTGDKSSVQEKPRLFKERGCVFVSTNYRLLPEVAMADIIGDVAAALGWVRANIARHGGDPEHIIVGGHSAGAQLAALVCTDDRHLKAHGVPFSALKGCIPVDGDTYDVPAIIETAETRRRVHGQPQAQFGHREKFGHTAENHRDFSAVTHIAAGKSIPPFLILHVSNHPDVSAQAFRLGAVLKAASVPVKVFGAKDTDHSKLNADLGLEGDAATGEVLAFLDQVLGR